MNNKRFGDVVKVRLEHSKGVPSMAACSIRVRVRVNVAERDVRD